MSKNFDRYYIEYSKEQEVKYDNTIEDIDKKDDIILNYKNELNYTNLIKDKEIWNFDILKTNKRKV